MNIEYIKLRTLAGKSVKVGSHEITPKTLSEIVEVGYEEYNKFLSLLCINDDVIEEFKNQMKIHCNLNNVGYLDYLAYVFLRSGETEEEIELQNTILKSISFFIDKDIEFSEHGFYHTEIKKITEAIGDRQIVLDRNEYHILDTKEFEIIKEIIKIQCCVLNEEIRELDENPANSHVKAILEKRKKAREKLKKAKKKNGDNDEELSLYDLASIVSSNCNGINILNVWELNMLQFNDQMNRMQMLDNYDVNIRALLAGADSKEINLVHWMSKIKHNDD